jgi:uncharacterized UPF0160 family protein
MGYAERWWPARAIVKEALENPVSADGKIVKLGQFCPWKEHLYELEKELGKEDKALYMLFMDSRGGWRIQCVGVEGQALKKNFPKKIFGQTARCETKFRYMSRFCRIFGRKLRRNAWKTVSKFEF